MLVMRPAQMADLGEVQRLAAVSLPCRMTLNA